MLPLRILHVIFSSRIAGAERYCVDLANRQSAAGNELHVAGAHGSPVGRALHREVQFHAFNFRLFRALSLRRLLTVLRPDICHGHLSPACKALARTASDEPTVATLHVGYKTHQHARMHGLICVNRAQRSRISGYEGLSCVIPNWLPQVPTGISETKIRDELGLHKEVFLIGAVGRLHKSKGMDVLIRAFRAMAPKKAALVILGEGPERSRLEQLKCGDDRIHLVGYRENVHGYLRDLDLFASPSREESFGLAIIEAMNAGIPIIATATEGPNEYMAGQPVKLVPPGSIDALTAALTEAHRNFCNHRSPRPSYDLTPFNPAVGVASVTDFYQLVLNARPQTQKGAAGGHRLVMYCDNDLSAAD